MLMSWQMVVLAIAFSHSGMLLDPRSIAAAVFGFVGIVVSAVSVVGANIVMLASIEVAMRCEGVE